MAFAALRHGSYVIFKYATGHVDGQNGRIYKSCCSGNSNARCINLFPALMVVHSQRNARPSAVRCYFRERCLGAHDDTKKHCGRLSVRVTLPCHGLERTIPVCDIAKVLVEKNGLAKYELLMCEGRSACRTIINDTLVQCKRRRHKQESETKLSKAKGDNAASPNAEHITEACNAGQLCICGEDVEVCGACGQGRAQRQARAQDAALVKGNRDEHSVRVGEGICDKEDVQPGVGFTLASPGEDFNLPLDIGRDTSKCIGGAWFRCTCRPSLKGRCRLEKMRERMN